MINILNFFNEALLHADHRIVNCSSIHQYQFGIGCLTCNVFCIIEVGFPEKLSKLPFVTDFIKDLKNISYKDPGSDLKRLAIKHADTPKRIERLKIMI
jgi:hypothetical protein